MPSCLYTESGQIQIDNIKMDLKRNIPASTYLHNTELDNKIKIKSLGGAIMMTEKCNAA